MLFISSSNIILFFRYLNFCSDFFGHAGKRLDQKAKVNPLKARVPHHIETSQLTSIANHLTGFYMMRNIGH